MRKLKMFSAVLLAAGLVLGLSGCPNGNDGGDVNVAFLNAVADGSATTASTVLTLTFSQAISGLTAGDFTFSGLAGVQPGVLSGNGPNYNLTITGVTEGGTLNVAVSRPGYVITGSPRQVTVFHVGDTGNGGGNDTGTGDDTANLGRFAQFFQPTHNSNNTGSTFVANNTNFDMLLFRGEALTEGNIVGGVRAGVASTPINLSNEANYNVGGWVVLRAVRLTAFESDGLQSRVDHSVMATFRQGTQTTVSIVSTTDGDFQFVVHNMSNQFALQLRENSPTGRVVAFLTRGEQNRVINSPTAEPMTLFPVWIGFSTQTMSVVEFAPTEPFSAQLAVPTQQGVGLTQNMHFPWTAGSPISFPVRAPAAVIRVQNNFDLAVNFRIGTTPLHATDAPVTVLGSPIISGDWRSFAMETPAAAGLNLNIFMVTGNVSVPVRFEGQTTNPVVAAGYYYLVEFEHFDGEPLTNPESFRAVITRLEEIDTTDVIQAP